MLIKLYFKCVFEFIFIQQFDTKGQIELYRTVVFVWSAQGSNLIFKTARKGKKVFIFLTQWDV